MGRGREGRKGRGEEGVGMMGDKEAARNFLYAKHKC